MHRHPYGLVRPRGCRHGGRRNGHTRSSGKGTAHIDAGRHALLQRQFLHRRRRQDPLRHTQEDAGHRGRGVGPREVSGRGDKQALHRRRGHAGRPLCAGHEEHLAAGYQECRRHGEPPAKEDPARRRVLGQGGPQHTHGRAHAQPMVGLGHGRRRLLARTVERFALCHVSGQAILDDKLPEEQQHRQRHRRRDRHNGYGCGLRPAAIYLHRHLGRTHRQAAYTLQYLASGQHGQHAPTRRGLYAQHRRIVPLRETHLRQCLRNNILCRRGFDLDTQCGPRRRRLTYGRPLAAAAGQHRPHVPQQHPHCAHRTA